MGLNADLLKAISRKGFSVPTPIQRKTIPLVMDGQDVVGMARVGQYSHVIASSNGIVVFIDRIRQNSGICGTDD